MITLDQASGIVDSLLDSKTAREQIGDLDKRYTAKYNKNNIVSVGYIWKLEGRLQKTPISTVYINFGYAKNAKGSKPLSIAFAFSNDRPAQKIVEALKVWIHHIHGVGSIDEIDISKYID
jgi:hypothetical protein